MKRWLALAMIAMLFVPPGQSLGQRVKAPEWTPFLFYFNDGYSFARSQMCYFEDMHFLGTVSGTIAPGETKKVTLYSELWDALQDSPDDALGREPFSGIPYGCFDWGPGNTALKVTAGVSKGTKLNDIELHVIGTASWLLANKIPKDSKGVVYGGSLVSTITPHLSWTPCTTGNDPIWGGWQNTFGASIWQIEVVNKSSKTANVGVTIQVEPMDCTGEWFFPPEYRGDTTYIEGLLAAEAGQ